MNRRYGENKPTTLVEMSNIEDLRKATHCKTSMMWLGLVSLYHFIVIRVRVALRKFRVDIGTEVHTTLTQPYHEGFNIEV